MQESKQLFEERTELQRQLGLPETLSIVVNRIIGSGIFRTPAPIMFITGSVGLFYGVWLLGGFATILGALCYAELVAMMPRSGGPYVFLKAAYPPVVTFLRGWAMFFVSETGAIAAVAIFFSENAISLLYSGQAKYAVTAMAIFIVLALTLVNSYGIKLSGTLQNIFGFSKIAILVLIVIAGFSKGIHTGHFQSAVSTSTFGGSVLAILTAMRYGFFAYSGWEGATYVAEEVKNPSKNLPVSLFAGIGIVMLLYLLINSAYLNLLGPVRMGNSPGVAVDSMRIAVGSMGAVFVVVAIMINTFSNVNTQIFVKSRTWFAMSRDQLFFSSLSKLHPRYKTPNHALTAQFIWATVLILFSSLANSAYEAVIDYFSFTSSIFNVLTFASVFVLRKKYPDIKRPYKTFGYPYTLAIVIFIQLAFMIATLVTALIPSLLGIALTATGLIYYKYAVPEKVKKDQNE